MRLIDKNAPIRDGVIVMGGCTHRGSGNAHKPGLKRLVTRLKDKEVKLYLNAGDNIEGKVSYDKHFSVAAIDLKERIISPHEQADAFVESMKDAVGHVPMIIGKGNHEHKLRNTWDAGKHIAEKLGARYGWYLYKFINRDNKGRVRFKILIHHGFGSLKSAAKDPIQGLANKMAALKQKFIGLRISDCLVSAGSHWHQQLIVPPTYLSEKHIIDQGGKITQHFRQHHRQNDNWIPPDARYYVATGCLRRSYSQPDDEYDDYSEINGYGASDLGWCEVDIQDYQVTGIRAVSV